MPETIQEATEAQNISPDTETLSNPSTPGNEQEIETAKSTAQPPDPDTAPRQAEDSRFNQNRVYLRGIIRGIRQELDSEDRQQNVLSLTTPNPLPENRVEVGLLDTFWGSNSRAGTMIHEFKAGDHVIVEAECRTFWTSLERGEVLYGLSIQKDQPAGITGLGDYEPAQNEALFVGTLRNIRAISDTMALLHLALHTHTEGRDINSYPVIAIYGRIYRVFQRHADRLPVGGLIGLACHIQIRPDRETGKKRIQWVVHGLMSIDENGERITIPIPPLNNYRAPRNNGPRRRTAQTVRSSAAEDLTRLHHGEESTSHEPPSAADVPAAELEPAPSEAPEEVIEYRPGEGTAEVLTNSKIREMATMQALQSLDDDTE